MAHVSAGNYDLVRSVREAAFRSSAACRTCQSWSFSEWLIASRTFGPEKGARASIARRRIGSRSLSAAITVSRPPGCPSAPRAATAASRQSGSLCLEAISESWSTTKLCCVELRSFPCSPAAQHATSTTVGSESLSKRSPSALVLTDSSMVRVLTVGSGSLRPMSIVSRSNLPSRCSEVKAADLTDGALSLSSFCAVSLSPEYPVEIAIRLRIDSVTPGGLVLFRSFVLKV